MYRTQRQTSPRSGFTLIELLVVIAIIAVLMALTSAAVMQVWGSGPKAQTRSEINDLEKALQKTMSEFGLTSAVPSRISLYRNTQFYMNPPAGLTAAQQLVDRRSYDLLMSMFGKQLFPGTATNIAWNGVAANAQNANTRYELSGPECLVFFAGGIVIPNGGVPANTGFGKNSAPDQAPLAGQLVRGKNFNFKANRLVPTKNPQAQGFYEYQDPYAVVLGAKGQTYAFFSSYGNDNGYQADGGTSQVAAAPTLTSAYLQSNNVNPVTKAATPLYHNPRMFQIISAGQDGLFDQGNPNIAMPSIQQLNAGAKDNQTNFTGGLLQGVSNN
jgi:prepilin-type N-terminal cleavage/methylation domain-containing protein